MTTLLKNNRTDRASLQKPAMTLVLLFSLFAFFLILTPILTGLLGRISHKHDAILRIAMVIQDLLVFILPALLTALVSTKLPARLLCIDTKPRAIIVLWSLLTLVVSIPAMNAIIEWNQNLHLPAAMSGFETTMRQLESNAQAVTDSLMAGASVPSLIVSILIVGILAGFSEELFFRGAMQRIMSASRMNMHAVIWSVAFIFSLFHFQFFGFAPRLLLGAYSVICYGGVARYGFLCSCTCSTIHWWCSRHGEMPITPTLQSILTSSAPTFPHSRPLQWCVPA